MADSGIGEFSVAVREHQSMVFSIALRLVRDPGLAEEVAQDTFLELYRSWGSMESPKHVLFWLRKVTVHRALDCIRKRHIQAEQSLDDVAEPAVEARNGDPLLDRRLNQLIGSLPEKARAVVVLRYQEDMGPEEIAEALNMPVATVKSHLQRSLAMLREKVARVLGVRKS